jgi:uncharacterized protein YfaS (alpha-2-macroglobulin family)
VRDADGVHFGGGARNEPTTRWADDPVETTAWALGAVLAADAKSDVLGPGARWLLSRRVDGARWQSTRDTAAAVAFLTRYCAATGDLGAGKTVRLSLNGQRLDAVTISAENAFTDAATIVVPYAALPKDAPLEVRAEPESGSATVSAALTFTETGPAIDEASAGFTVRRTWNLLVPETRADGSLVYVAKPWTESVPAGAFLEAEVTVEVPEPRDFVMLTSPHPAGFEPEKRFFEEARKSLHPPGRADHVEVRDDRTVFFATRLERGTWVYRHAMRATHVGSFTALPAQVELMYFPRVRGNSKGEVVEVSKGAPAGRPGPGEGGR